MIKYEDYVLKSLKKGKPPIKVFVHFNNAFISLDLTKDLSLFDIKKLQGVESRIHYRLRKGKYRALFYIEDGNIFVYKIDKREDVYKKWV